MGGMDANRDGNTEHGGRRYAITFDAGTTAIKCALVRDDGMVAAASSGELDLVADGGRREQSPAQRWEVFRTVCRATLGKAEETEPGFADRLTAGRAGDAAARGGASLIAGVIMSGQMQDVIALDDGLRPVRDAILYSDGRADEEAAALAACLGGGGESGACVGMEWFLETVGNRLEGCLPLPKLMWMRTHEGESYARTAHVLISSKDWLNARLTGVCADDVAACSTAGAMGIRAGAWDARLCAASGVDPALLPALHDPQDVIGAVRPDAASATGIPAGTPVHAGFGDAGATTFASGVTRPGDYNINLGTSGWVATVSPEPFTDGAGAANLRYGVAPGFVNAVPFLNAGDVHRWAVRTLAGGDYAAAHRLLAASRPGAGGVLCLPYLVGERFPVMNPDVRGGFVGISPTTTPGDLLRAALEGVALSIRQGMEGFDEPPARITLIGGGARETVWCQVMADALGHPVVAFGNADILPAVALASLVFADPGLPDKVRASAMYRPDPAAVAVYDRAYPRFTRLCPALSGLARFRNRV